MKRSLPITSYGLAAARLARSRMDTPFTIRPWREYAGPARSGAAVRARERATVDGWIVAALCAAAVLRAVQLGTPALWYDAVITAQWLRLPWLDMVQAAAADKHPPLYFVLLKAWTLLAGDSELALRLPSALASWLAVPAIAAVAWYVRGRGAARWAAWAAALSPFLIEHGQEARMYAIGVALAALQL